jgi:putative transposase
MDTSFCLDALHEAIDRYGTPEIFNSDQGSQFTSEEFTSSLISNEIKISMDGKGRWVDNVIIERAWKSVKYEEVYLKAYESMAEAKEALNAYSSITIVSDAIRALTGEPLMKFTGVPYPNRG